VYEACPRRCSLGYRLCRQRIRPGLVAATRPEWLNPMERSGLTPAQIQPRPLLSRRCFQRFGNQNGDPITSRVIPRFYRPRVNVLRDKPPRRRSAFARWQTGRCTTATRARRSRTYSRGSTTKTCSPSSVAPACTATTRSCGRPGAKKIVSPGRQFGTELTNLGGSAGSPFASSSLKGCIAASSRFEGAGATSLSATGTPHGGATRP
jgi:hypothetical protein